jgi:hypothetical protein
MLQIHATFFFVFEWICLFLKVPNEGCFSTKSGPWRFSLSCTKKLLSQSRLFHGHGLQPLLKNRQPIVSQTNWQFGMASLHVALLALSIHERDAFESVLRCACWLITTN